MPHLDDQEFDALVAAVRERVPAQTPGWTDHNDSDPGITLLALFPFLAEELAARRPAIGDGGSRQIARTVSSLLALDGSRRRIEVAVDGEPWTGEATSGGAADGSWAKALRWLLLALGLLAASAVVPMVMPTAWMEAITVKLGLEPLPRTPLTQYLTRSLSAIYAMLGVLVLYLAADVRRYREVIAVMGWLTAALGVALTVLDFWAGMPAKLVLGEGPPTVVLGGVLVWLARRLRR